MNRCQITAIYKGIFADACHAVGDCDRGQAAATREGIAADTCHAISYHILLYTIVEDVFHRKTGRPCCRHDGIAVQNNRGQAAAKVKGLAANACHAIWDGDGGQAAATREGTIANACHAIWDDDGSQAAATREGTAADTCHAVGDGDGSQAATIMESKIANACHAIRHTIICDRFRNNDRTRI